MIADLIIYNIKTLYTPFHKPPLRKEKLNEIKEINDAFIAIKKGVIIAVDQKNYKPFIDENTKLYDAKQKIALPGFIDAHTHLVHAGSREEEFALLKQGIPYLEILNKGGGILNTVEKTRAASYYDLLKQSRESLDIMLTFGVTTVETKSGYGLRLNDEIKQLDVAKALKDQGPQEITITYMGAHAYPREYKNDKKGYVDELIKDLETIKKLGFIDTVDVFCEKGVFELEDTEKILMKAKQLDFKIRLHADELETLGGAGLAVKLKAKSADHLIAVSNEDIINLGKSDTYACLLPGTSFNLQKPYAKARKMVNNNVALCIAGDYNPGSCPTENFQLIMQIAASYYQLTPYEILNAVTINPAHLLDLENKKGSLDLGKDADILLLDIPNLSYLMYHFGVNHVNDVFIKGNQVVKNKIILGENNEIN